MYSTGSLWNFAISLSVTYKMGTMVSYKIVSTKGLSFSIVFCNFVEFEMNLMAKLSALEPTNPVFLAKRVCKWDSSSGMLYFKLKLLLKVTICGVYSTIVGFPYFTNILYVNFPVIPLIFQNIDLSRLSISYWSSVGEHSSGGHGISKIVLKNYTHGSKLSPSIR